MHNLIAEYRRPLLAFVAALACGTAVSVWMAIHALIDDALMAALFASLALILDLFKYIAWPLALCLMAMRRAMCALLMMGCALILGGVSGWATYDRLMWSIVGSRTAHEALQEQRLTDLEEARRDDAARIEQLDTRAAAIGEQANGLRERGMVSRALDLETAALARIDSQRDAAIARRDAASQELTAIRSQPAKAAGLPLELATLLCLGFAAALEIVPALILSSAAGAGCRAETCQELVQEQQPETNAAHQEQREEQQESTAHEQPGTAQDKASDELEGKDKELLQVLRRMIASAEVGAKFAVRKVARELRIGNERAGRIVQAAAAMGELRKTDAGYVAA